MFAVLHISEFSLHAVLRATPGLVSAQPVAILAHDTTASAGSRAIVLAANLPSRALGITAGLTASQALARCAALRLLSASPAAEAEARAALLATASQPPARRPSVVQPPPPLSPSLRLSVPPSLRLSVPPSLRLSVSVPPSLRG